ncbi:MAG: hypothetical protein ABW250_08405, partial [Pyrinomonadaceae bacterium]
DFILVFPFLSSAFFHVSGSFQRTPSVSPPPGSRPKQVPDDGDPTTWRALYFSLKTFLNTAMAVTTYTFLPARRQALPQHLYLP